jgi:hypothetical protein
MQGGNDVNGDMETVPFMTDSVIPSYKSTGITAEVPRLY